MTAVLRKLGLGALALVEEKEHGGRVLPLEALLHVLRGNDRVVVVRDDAPRHSAHVAQPGGAPDAEPAERGDEDEIADEELRSETHVVLGCGLGAPPVALVAVRPRDRHDVDGRIPYFVEEVVDHRAADQDVPVGSARSGRR